MIAVDVINLIAKTYTTDELGQKVPVESKRELYAKIDSVSQSEFFRAGEIGLKPALKATLSFYEDYNDEGLVEYAGKRYAIYRTFVTSSGQLELYLQKEAGEANGET